MWTLYANTGAMPQYFVKKRTMVATRLLGFLGLLWLSMAVQACLLAPPLGKVDISQVECRELAMGQDAQAEQCNPIANLDCELPKQGPLTHSSIDTQFTAPVSLLTVNLAPDLYRQPVITGLTYYRALPPGPSLTVQYGVFLI